MAGWVLAKALMVFLFAGATPALAHAQHPAAAAKPLVFDGVSIVDVEQGKVVPDQRVVVVGNRIQAIGTPDNIELPKDARVVAARGKFLIPGLWEMHTHLYGRLAMFYSGFIAHGVTGVRDMGGPYNSAGHLDTLMRWRQEIAAGLRIGPRALLTGQYFSERSSSGFQPQTPAEGRSIVDSLQALGVDHIKLHVFDSISRNTYFAILDEGRRLGVTVVGHLPHAITLREASDSGQRSIEHLGWLLVYGGLDSACGVEGDDNSCAALAARFRQNGTWLTPTILVSPGQDEERPVAMERMQRVGMPLLAGVDDIQSIQDELSGLVEAGLTPLNALRAATLNPALYLHATDSLGTVAAGKLADLVLLDANPIADIANVSAIRAVVANGRYFDRTALDTLQAKAR